MNSKTNNYKLSMNLKFISFESATSIQKHCRLARTCHINYTCNTRCIAHY